MSASPLTILPSHNGVNLAPLEPLRKIGEGDKNPSAYLADAIKERFNHFKSQEEATWREIISSGEEVALFLAGKQFLMPNRLKPGGWLPYAPQSDSSPAVRRALSLMQYHTSGNLEKWENSNPDIRVRPGVGSDDAREAAEAARIVVDHYEAKFYRPRVTQAECLEGLTFGSYLWRLRVDPTLKTVTAYRQVFENREVRIGPGWGKCGDCGNEGDYDDFTAIGDGTYSCPKCHGEAMVIEPATDEVPQAVDSQPVELGDFRLDLLSIAQCRWDLRHHADESPWLIVERRAPMSALRQTLGNVKLPGQPGGGFGLDTLDRLAYQGQAQAGHGREGQRKDYKDGATIEEFWMSADEYGDIRLQRDAETVGGVNLPKDTRLGELLKGKSICVLGINEMSTILGVYVEDHRDYVAQGKWYAKAGTGAGRGLQDLTEVQKVFNSDHQLIHTHLRSGAAPAMLVASEVLGEEGKASYLGTPGMNIPVPLAMLAEGVKMEELVRPAFQPTSTSGQIFEFTYNRLNEFAQFASHFLPFASGMPGVDNRTATGANITQAATNALYTPVLSVKGEVRKLVAEKLIKLYPRHFPIERYFPMGGKYGRHSGKMLSGANLQTDLIFEVVPDSWQPRNSFVKRQDYGVFVGLFGGVLGWLQARQADPGRVADMERTFDLELESETRNVAESLCFRRVRQMQQSASLVPDPQILLGQIQPPVSQAEPAHEVKRQWLMEWLDSDDGQEADASLRAAVEQLILLHTEYAGAQAAMLAGQAGAVQVAGQAPQMMAQAEAQAAQGQQQLEQQKGELELQALQEVGAQVAADADVEREATREGLKAESKAAQVALKQADREGALAVRREQEAMRQ